MSENDSPNAKFYPWAFSGKKEGEERKGEETERSKKTAQAGMKTLVKQSINLGSDVSSVEAILLCLQQLSAIRFALLELLDNNLIRVEMIFSGPALVIKTPPKWFMEPGLTYSFRIVVENPAGTFNNVNEQERWWAFETRTSKNRFEDRVDYNYMVPSFPVHQRILFFGVETMNQIGSAETTLKISFKTMHDVPAQNSIIVRAPEQVVFALDDPYVIPAVQAAREGQFRPCLAPGLPPAETQAMRAAFKKVLDSD